MTIFSVLFWYKGYLLNVNYAVKAKTW